MIHASIYSKRPDRFHAIVTVTLSRTRHSFGFILVTDALKIEENLDDNVALRITSPFSYYVQ